MDDTQLIRKLGRVTDRSIFKIGLIYSLHENSGESPLGVLVELYALGHNPYLKPKISRSSSNPCASRTNPTCPHSNIRRHVLHAPT